MAAKVFFSSIFLQTSSGHSCLKALRIFACTDFEQKILQKGELEERRMESRGGKAASFFTFSYRQYLLPFMDNICFLLWLRNISLSKNIILSNSPG